MADKNGDLSAQNISHRRLNDLEAHILFAIRESGGVGLTYDEITRDLAGQGIKKEAGYIRRVVKALEGWRLLERITKDGPKKITLAFAIPEDGMNSRRVTSLMLLELMRQAKDEEELPERDEFVEILVKLGIQKKSGKIVTKPEIEKALQFCEDNYYIEHPKNSEDDDDTIRVADRFWRELPFIELVAFSGQKRGASSELKGKQRKHPARAS